LEELTSLTRFFDRKEKNAVNAERLQVGVVGMLDVGGGG
jgi:hypothetical protein